MKAWVEPSTPDEQITINIFHNGSFHQYAKITSQPATWHTEYGLTYEEMSHIEIDTT